MGKFNDVFDPADDMDSGAAGEVAPVVPVATAPVENKPKRDFTDQEIRDGKIKGLVETSDISIEGLALETKRKLSLEKKVRMMIPLDQGEKSGAYRTVSINGYRFDVKKNMMVDLPESVAQLLADAYRITTEVVENNPLNLNQASDRKKEMLDA